MVFLLQKFSPKIFLLRSIRVDERLAVYYGIRMVEHLERVATVPQRKESLYGSRTEPQARRVDRNRQRHC